MPKTPDNIFSFFLFLLFLSLHLQDICHVCCRPVFERNAYKVHEIKTGRPCSTQWFKEHQEEIYSFFAFAWQSTFSFDYTTWRRLKITTQERTNTRIYLAAFETLNILEQNCLPIFLQFYIISLSKRNIKVILSFDGVCEWERAHSLHHAWLSKK